MLFAKQDDSGDQKIQVGGAKTAWKPHRGIWIVSGTDQIDIGVAVDLSTTQKKHVNSPLGCTVEQFRAAIIERAMGG